MPQPRVTLSNPLDLPNHPSSLDSVNNKANLLNLSLETLVRRSNSNPVRLHSVNRTRAVVVLPAFLARRRRLLASHLQLEETPPLGQIRGTQETPSCQSQRLGVAHLRV